MYVPYSMYTRDGEEIVVWAGSKHLPHEHRRVAREGVDWLGCLPRNLSFSSFSSFPLSPLFSQGLMASDNETHGDGKGLRGSHAEYGWLDLWVTALILFLPRRKDST
jgi:hypothetical protein